MSTTEQETRYEIGTTKVEGLEFTVTVNEHGMFFVTFDGEVFAADSLSRLRSQLQDAILGSRLEVPFVGLDGRRGIMRGWHAGNRDVLITWQGGEKDRLNTHRKVYEPDEMTDTEFEDLRKLHERYNELREQIDLYDRRAVPAERLFKAAFQRRFGQDPMQFGRHTGQREVGE